MVIECPGCGRSYDEARFGDGRARTCMCGALVGPEPLPLHLEDDPKFFADTMLGGLARWLRVLGFDTLFEPGIDDLELIARARADDRMVLTRDRQLVRFTRGIRVLYVDGNHPVEQLTRLCAQLELGQPARPFTRCTICNEPLVPTSLDEASSRVPEQVRKQGRTLFRCPACERVYWEGSHTARMRETLHNVCGMDLCRPPDRETTRSS